MTLEEMRQHEKVRGPSGTVYRVLYVVVGPATQGGEEHAVLESEYSREYSLDRRSDPASHTRLTVNASQAQKYEAV